MVSNTKEKYEYFPKGINIELTTYCPLKCKQCYCSLIKRTDIDISVAKERINEAFSLGVKKVHLSGGETLCYPHLFELISHISKLGMDVNVATSGYNLTQEQFDLLTRSGVSEIHISLNGSNKKTNELTRDGYELAIGALELLSVNNYEHTNVNWVMHSNNAEDFSNMIELLEKYNVSTFTILSVKPDSKNELNTFPSAGQIKMVAKLIKDYKGNLAIKVEPCFSQLRAVVCDTKLFGNLNVGLLKGCLAGVVSYCIDVNGKYTPCRHFMDEEAFVDFDEFWHKSKILTEIRNAQHVRYCLGCRYADNCTPCFATTYKLTNKIESTHPLCELNLL